MTAPDMRCPAEQALAAIRSGRMDMCTACRRFGTTVAAVQEACADSPEGHRFELTDDGLALWTYPWRKCTWCEKVKEEEEPW